MRKPLSSNKSAASRHVKAAGNGTDLEAGRRHFTLDELRLPDNGHRRHGVMPSPDPEDRAAFARLTTAQLARFLLAELIGSFALTLVSCGMIVIASTPEGAQISPAMKALAPALMIATLIYSIGDSGGAHYNPAVTLAFTLLRLFPARRLPAYWAAQITGGVMAALLLRAAFGNAHHLGAPEPRAGIGIAFCVEAIGAFLYLLSTLGTSTRYSSVGPNAAIARGAMLGAISLLGAPLSGASFNPQRALGPMIASWHVEFAWLYLLAPLAGMLAAVAAMTLLHRRPDLKQYQAAQGDPSKVA